MQIAAEILQQIEDVNPCSIYNPDWWFPEKEDIPSANWRTSPFNSETARFAKSLCRSCPIIESCRREVDKFESRFRNGLDKDNMFGIWAGETPSERIARRRRAGFTVVNNE